MKLQTVDSYCLLFPNAMIFTFYYVLNTIPSKVILTQYDILEHVKQDNTLIIICHLSVCVIFMVQLIIIPLNFIITGLHGYEITPGLSTNKQRHRLLLSKTRIHAAPTHL